MNINCVLMKDNKFFLIYLWGKWVVHIRGKIQVILLAQSYAGVCVSRYPNTCIADVELLVSNLELIVQHLLEFRNICFIKQFFNQ